MHKRGKTQRCSADTHRKGGTSSKNGVNEGRDEIKLFAPKPVCEEAEY
jgi:hypothetical protein